MRVNFRYCYNALLAPQSHADDTKRREFILNVLLVGLGIVISLFLVFSLLHSLDLQIDQREDLAALYATYLCLVAGLWRISRQGQIQLASLGLLLLLFIAATKLTLHYSFELPISELLYAVLVVFAGILLEARAALIITGFIAVTLLGISYAETMHSLHPRLDWVQQDFQLGDAIGYIAVLCLMALVSWLSNLELGRSLACAKESERALVEERNSLELKVAARTRELEQAQLLRVMELERFASFGRVSANLLHELANPLTAAGLQLDQLTNYQSPRLKEARLSLQQMERYITAARHQLVSTSKKATFSARDELNSVLQIMRPLADRAHIKLAINTQPCYLFGDPIKFNQLLSNLIANALDACQNAVDSKVQKCVQISLKPSRQRLMIQVIDNGRGIHRVRLPYIFEPFYSTKTASGKSLGLGLPLVKKIAEDDFDGKVEVNSTYGHGSVFTATLKGVQLPKNIDPGRENARVDRKPHTSYHPAYARRSQSSM